MSASFDERRAALRDRHATWRPRPLSAFLADAAAEFGDRPLVITDDRVLTYAEVDAWATRLADGIRGLGIEPGDRVGIVMSNYPEFMPLKFAVARAGAVAVPLNFLYKASELELVVGKAGCRMLVTMTGFAGLDHLGMVEEIRPKLPALEHVVQLSTDGREAEGIMTLAELEAAGAANPLESLDVDPESLSDILFTSGTTGSPKGVMVTHDSTLRSSFASAHHRAFQDGRRVLFSLPCYHMFGYIEGLLASMFVGGAIIPRTAFDPVDHFKAMAQHRADDVLCVPTMSIALLEHPERSEHDISSISACLSGAAAGPVWLWERFASDMGITEITTGYGMTETGGAMTMTRPEDGPELHSTTVGRPLDAGPAGMDGGGELAVYETADPMSGERLGAGAEGELVSTGPTHMLGFWEMPDETAAALRDGWVFSGDLGFVGDDGYLRLTGRSKELYKSGGELVMPKEVEAVLAAHDGVSQAYAVGVPDERWGEIGCAWVVPEPGVELDPEELIALCKEQLARFKVPKHVLITSADQLPTTPTGKVQKFMLSKQAAERLA